MTRQEFALAIGFYCARFNGSVTSWLRTAARNNHNGGHPRSQHLRGTAADIVYDDGVFPPIDEASEFASGLGLKVVRESDHDHVQAL